jgi:peptide/nickel transport system ATP-binding protein
VSVQQQVLELLNELRRKFGLSMLFITHDLRVAATVCEEIAIIAAGWSARSRRCGSRGPRGSGSRP